MALVALLYLSCGQALAWDLLGGHFPSTHPLQSLRWHKTNAQFRGKELEELTKF